MKKLVALGLVMAGLLSSGRAQQAPPATVTSRAHATNRDGAPAPSTGAVSAAPPRAGTVSRSPQMPRLGTAVTPLQSPRRFSPISPMQVEGPATRTFRHFDTLPRSGNARLTDADLQLNRRQPTDSSANRANEDDPRAATNVAKPHLPSQNRHSGDRGSSKDNNVTPATFRPHRGGTPVVGFNNNNRWSFDEACRRNRHHHDRGWWCNNFSTIILIGGGYYAWDAGWWYPAWGYDPYYSSYSFDGPIYGYDGLPPDQVIANVQSALQELGYFPYAVDGVLGPVTRDAIADYQRDHGIYVTGAIDRQTLVSLGFVL